MRLAHSAAEWRGMRRLRRRMSAGGSPKNGIAYQCRRSAPALSILNRSIPPMRNSEYRANQEWKATPKWTERPARKPGIQLSTVLKVGFWIILATAIGMEVLPWLSANIAGA